MFGVVKTLNLNGGESALGVLSLMIAVFFGALTDSLIRSIRKIGALETYRLQADLVEVLRLQKAVWINSLILALVAGFTFCFLVASATF